ncbi:MAG: efflux RND transporter permease subunit [Polyangia bacterium]
MSVPRFAVDNPVMANLLMVAIVVLGSLSLYEMPRELFPDISMNWVFIIKPYPGVSPEEIEKRITIPIEEEIQDIRGIDSISSQSSEGSSFISIKFEDMSDSEFRDRFEDLRTAVESVEDLPEDALETNVEAFSSADFMPVISVHIHGALSERRLIDLAEELRDSVREIPDVSKVDITGARDRELWIEADPVALEGYGASLERIRLAIATHGVDVPGGKLSFGRREMLVRTVGEFASPEEVERVIVRSAPDGGTVRVGDVAVVTPGFEDERTRSRLDGDPVVSLQISKQAEGNSIEITDEIKRVAREFDRRHGELVRVSFTQDTSEQIRDILSKLSRNAVAGFAVVLVVLLAVLGVRNALIAALGIPLSFLAAFIAMHRMGESFNGNSLFGLVLVLGIIVDDAIIIVENCYRHRQQGKRWREAAIDGTTEVMLPVLSATATTIAAFLPLILLPGIMGKFLRIVPIALSLALLASMIEAFFILPSHLAEWPGRDRPIRAERQWIVSLRGSYEKALRFVLRRRYLFCFLLVPALLAGAGSLIMTGVIGVDLYAGEEMGTFQVRMRMPVGTNLETTSKTLEELEEIAAELPEDELRSVHATAGLIVTDDDWIYRTDVGQLWLDLTPIYERARTTDEIIEDLRGRLLEVAGPERLELAKINQGPPTGKPIEAKVKGRFFDELEAVAEELKEELSAVDGAVDVGDDFESGKREMRLRVDPRRAAMHGLDTARVGMALMRAIDGVEADTMYEGDEEIAIVVRLDSRRLEAPEDVLDLPLIAPGGEAISFGDVASLELGPSIDQIRRYKLERAITVFSNLDEQRTDTVEANAAIQRRFEQIRDRHPGVSLDFSGEFKEFKESLAGIGQLFALGILLIYIILGSQFRSYIQPLVVLGTVPLAFVGATLGLLVSGNPFSVLALYGWVALAGVAVNDAIVLVSFINARRREGMDPFEAVIEGGKLRLRPIILTSVTTMAGLLPMATGLGGMSLTWGPMANTIVWGIGLGTFMTLFLIPALYTVIQVDPKERARRRHERRASRA